MTDVGTLDDKNFNEASWSRAPGGREGHRAAPPQSSSPRHQPTTPPNIQTFIDQEYDIIVTVGFDLANDTVKAAKANPNVKFIGVDQGVCIDEPEGRPRRSPARATPKTLLPNYQASIFAEDQAGYLAGIVAA